MPTSARNDAGEVDLAAARRGLVEVRLKDAAQFFDTLDPSPFHERDIDPDAEAYIVESVREMPSRLPCEVVVHIDQTVGPADEETLFRTAIREHFDRRANVLRRRRHQLIRRGLASLAIGAAFLVAVTVLAQLLGEDHGGLVVKQGLQILGWVAMWRPLEIFLYDWWPILGEERICRRLSSASVRVVHSA